MRTTLGARFATGAAVLAILLGPVSSSAQAPPRLLLFLNGSEVSTPVVSAERVGNEIYLPVDPIADRLQAGIELTPGERLAVSDPILGRVTEYEQATGLIRRDGTILFGLAAGLLRGSTPADLQVPLPLVTIFFDLEAQIPPAGDRVELASRVGVPEARLHAPSDVHVREVRYRGYANHFDGFTDGGLGVDATARLYGGVLEASALGQGEEGHIAHLRTATLTYRDLARSVWSAGDLRGDFLVLYADTVFDLDLPAFRAFHAAGNPNTQLRNITQGSALAQNFVMAFPKYAGTGGSSALACSLPAAMSQMR